MILQHNILFTLTDGSVKKVSTQVEIGSFVTPVKTVCDFDAIPVQDVVSIATETKLDQIIEC